ncbi:MAG: 3-dehydroquinate synthase [Candidatus Peregrinibacteria bacterium]
MTEISVCFPAQSKNYSLFISKGGRAQIPELIRKMGNFSRIAVIADSHVAPIWGTDILQNLLDEGFAAELFSFPAGEENKNEGTVQKLLYALLEKKYGRDTLILAVGGGVTGDIAGFTASIFLRGVPFFQIPTSVLAMVDSSVGGKVGVDTPFGKNLIGSFWQPKAVIIDPETLETLPEEERKNGVVEAFKMFLTSHKTAFEWAEKNLSLILQNNAEQMQKMVETAVTIKKGVVERDETEKGERAILNFGHTIGHTIELSSNFSIAHGHAVALGILVENRISRLLGYLSEEDETRILKCIRSIGFDFSVLKKHDPQELLTLMQSDKKTENGAVRFVFLSGLGTVLQEDEKWCHSVPGELIIQALLDIRSSLGDA